MKSPPRFTSTFDPARSWRTIEQDDDAVLSPAPKALWVNEACTLVLMGEDEAIENFVVSAPGPVDLSPTRIMEASTAGAGMIKGLFD